MSETPKTILGISAYYHDSAAALVVDGEVVAAAQEERFSRKKADDRFPRGAVDFCLKKAGIKIDQVDAVVFYDKPILKMERVLSSFLHRAPKGLPGFLGHIPLWLREKLWTDGKLAQALDWDEEILYCEHHMSHAASAFYPSPFEKAAVLTVDGMGEWTTTTIGIGEGSSLKILKEIKFPDSLGLLYSAFTLYCGFRINSGEYKLMGLAPYGQPKYLDLIKKYLIELHPDGSFKLNQRYFNYISGLKMFNRRFEKLLGRRALKKDQTPDQFYMDVAASIQALTSEVMVGLAKQAKALTGADHLVMAGGVALNCVANTQVLLQAGFKEVWIQPAAGDSGGALGAALYAHHGLFGAPRRLQKGKDSMKGALLGPDFNDQEIEKILKDRGAVFTKAPSTAELLKTVAGYLANEKVVGWFQGPMEFGPRALGGRSILGDPRSEAMQSLMNLKIKFRESFRPFAPSVLAEEAQQVFDFPQASPYMLFTAPVKESWRLKIDPQGKFGMDLLKLKRSKIPAVTHVDYSARLQTVHPESSPLYHRLIKEFQALTGVPLLINTSFNVRGEPIVCTPADAYRCFLGTHMDYLVLGSYILKREDQTSSYEEMKKWKATLIRD